MSANIEEANQGETASDLSTERGRKTSENIWRLVQRGLVYPAPCAIFVTFFRSATPKTAITKELLGRVLKHVRRKIHTDFRSKHTTAILGVSFGLWRELSAEDGSSLPLGMSLRLAPSDNPTLSSVFNRPGTAFKDSAADLWFHIKSDDADHCKGVLEYLRNHLEEELGCVDRERTLLQDAETKSNRPDRRGGKVLGGRFSENLNNATDPLTIQQHAIVGHDDPTHVGASFVLAQRFVINWEHVLAMAPEHIEDLVGRKTDDTLIPSRDDRSHIKRARAQDAHGNTTPVLRLGLPFGSSNAVESDALSARGANAHDEQGIYFAGFAKSAGVLETIMDRQIGDVPGFMSDRLLAHVRSDWGGFFYIPSLPDLGLDPEAHLKGRKKWKEFPGVDWSRLDRHFDECSANGYMHYNHKEYLYRMATVPDEDRKKVMPPSHRILSLLADAFSRWQDNWYFDRAQAELSHLRVYLERSSGKAKADEVMALSIAERGGWAAKVLLGQVLVSDEYGYRGRRPDAHGNPVNGADTYRIHPADIIVGSMPNIGLGQGKHLIDFARDDEQLSNFFDNLSYASGVGHIVPQFRSRAAPGPRPAPSRSGGSPRRRGGREEAAILCGHHAGAGRRGGTLPRFRAPRLADGGREDRRSAGRA